MQRSQVDQGESGIDEHASFFQNFLTNVLVFQY